MSSFVTWIQLLKHRAARQPDQTAYIFLQDGEQETLRLTYQQLDVRACAIAARLQSLDLAGERALLLYPSGLDFVAAFLGCLYAGVVAVPAYPPRPNQKMTRLTAIVTDAEAKVLLTTDALLKGIESRFAQTSDLAALHSLATDTVSTDEALRWQEPAVTSDTLAFLQYTSGSTGSPKGVMVSHGNLLHNCEYMRQTFALTPASVAVSWLPCFHDMGLVFGILEPLYNGNLDILMPPTAFVQRPIRWLQAISRYQATHSGGPNFAYELCLQKIKPAQIESLDLSSWRFAYNGAEPVRRSTLEQFAERFRPWGFRPSALYPCYGMAEATLMISGGSGEADPMYCCLDADALAQDQITDATSATQRTSQLVGCGRPWLDTQIIIADPESLTQCPPNRVGEIWTSGGSVTQGYWQRPEQTEQTFAARLQDTGAGPFLRTGDLGFIKHGELFITGRLKDVVIVRGRNHYPQDIELTVQQSHPALKIDCGAAFTVDDNGAERLVVVQEVHRQALRQLDVEAIALAIRRAVAAEHELEIAAIALIKPASIPKTSSGKIQRRACKAGFLTETLRVVGLWQPTLEQGDRPETTRPQAVPIPEQQNQIHSPDQTAAADVIQAWLVAKLSAQLNLDPQAIDPQQSLAQYGLDSLAMVTLAGELEDWLGHKLPNTVVYAHPSIAALAQHLAQTSKPELPSCLVPLQPQGRKPPLFCVHPLAGVAFPYYPLMRSMGTERPFYVLQAVGIETAEQPLTAIEAMAAHYIEAIRRVQPQGPYHVAGWSFGAYVALEIATQLRQQGQPVAKVILLDTPPLSANKLSNLIDLLTFFLTSSAPHIWPYIYDYIQLQLSANQLPKDGNFWDLIRLLNPETIVKLWERESRLMTLRQPAVQRVIGVIKANSEALIQYQPKPYTGKITLFNGDPLFGINAQNSIAGWLNLAQGGTEVYQIPGHHFSVLRHPHVEVLAKKLNACLDSA